VYKDEIINEVWKNREDYLKLHNHDLEEIINDLKVRQEKSGRTIVDRRSIPNEPPHPLKD